MLHIYLNEDSHVDMLLVPSLLFLLINFFDIFENHFVESTNKTSITLDTDNRFT